MCVTTDGMFMIIGVTMGCLSDDASKINIYGIEHGTKLNEPMKTEFSYGNHCDKTQRIKGCYYPHEKEITGIVAKTSYQGNTTFYSCSKDFYVKEWCFNYQTQKVHLSRTWKNLDLDKNMENENWRMMLTRDECWVLVADEWNTIYQLPTDNACNWEGRAIKKYSNLGLSRLASWAVDKYSQIMYIGDENGDILEVQMDETRAVHATMSHKRKVGDKKITSICISPDERSLLCGDQAGDMKRVQIGDRNDTGKEFLGKIHRNEINRVATFNDSERQKW